MTRRPPIPLLAGDQVGLSQCRTLLRDGEKELRAGLSAGNYAFGRNQVSPDGTVAYQEVLISAPDGKDWAVYYELKRQRDGQFAINGVRMMRETNSQGI